MILKKEIEKRLLQIYEEFKEDEEDLTAWTFERKLHLEANGDESLIRYFKYLIVIIAFEFNEIITPFLSEFLTYPAFDEHYCPTCSNYPEGYNPYPEVYFEKGIKTKLLEKLDLNLTLKEYYKYLTYISEELNHTNYLSNEDIEIYSNFDKAMDKILDTFWIEMKKKCPKYFNENLNNDHRIIKFSK